MRIVNKNVIKMKNFKQTFSCVWATNLIFDLTL